MDATTLVRTLFLPFVTGGLLLPMSVVAEIVDYVEPEADPGSDLGGGWILGHISWRGQALLVCSLCPTDEGDPESTRARERIAILRALNYPDQIPFFGVVIHGLPSLVLAANDTLHWAREQSRDWAYVLGEVEFNGKRAWIPDLARIEVELAQYQEVTRS